MGREDDVGALGDVVDVFDGDSAFAFKGVDDVGVVDYLVLDIDGRAVAL